MITYLRGYSAHCLAVAITSVCTDKSWKKNSFFNFSNITTEKDNYFCSKEYIKKSTRAKLKVFNNNTWSIRSSKEPEQFQHIHLTPLLPVSDTFVDISEKIKLNSQTDTEYLHEYNFWWL